MEHHLEARLWNDVFKLAQDYIGMPRGTIRGTCLIETITAVFHVRATSVGDDLTSADGRDYLRAQGALGWPQLRPLGLCVDDARLALTLADIFSFIKKNRYKSSMVLPDRSAVTMTVPFMGPHRALGVV